MSLVEWLRAVIEHRQTKAAAPGSEVAAGLRQCAAFGVTTIGDIAQPGDSHQAYHGSPCDGVVFAELIAPTTQRIPTARDFARQHLASSGFGAWQQGLSPHAPYTVHPALLEEITALSDEHAVPLAMHLAESREEVEFLHDGAGPFRELLESRGAWDPSAWPRGSRPLDVLRILAKAHRAIIVHGNYLAKEEIALLAERRERMAVVYCPRTHAWFGHDAYPLETLLAAGATVALGTDSRASSPDLSLLAEMRHVSRQYVRLDRAKILELGTLAGARALGLEQSLGSLEPGKWANLAVVRLPSPPDADPHESLLDGPGAVVQTWFRGEAAG